MGYKISENSVNALLRISDVSEETGLSVLTLRNWEKRYGIPTPTRTQGGQRLYSVSQITLLKQIKEQIEQGHKPGKILRSIAENQHQSSLDPAIIPVGSEPLVQLIYVSRPTTTLSQAELNELIKKAAVQNQLENITGILLKTTQHFVQAIEGPRSAINKLYNKITSDSRHSTVTILKYQPIQERSFAKWSMTLLTNKDINQKILSKLNLRNDFDPYRLNDLSAHSLLSFASQES